MAVLLGVVLILFCATSSAWSDDSTTTKDGRGAEVVDATVEQLRSICVDDKQFLSRMAWVLTEFGAKNGTFDQNALGGMWNVTEKMFNETMPKMLKGPWGKFATDKLNMNADVKLYRNGELRKPLHSAYVFEASVNITMEYSVEEQMQAYAKLLHPNDTTRADSLAKKWTEAMKSYPKSCPSTRADVAFVLDLSTNARNNSLKDVKKFMMETISGLEIAEDAFRVAVYVFRNDSFEVVLNFNDILNKTQLMNALDARSFSDFFPVKNITRLSNTTFLDICNRSQANPTMFVFISDLEGSNRVLEHVAMGCCKIQRLQISVAPQTATSDFVSKPVCMYSYKLASFNQLFNISDDLRSRLCHTYATQNININDTIAVEHNVRGDRYFYKAYKVYSDAGLTFSFANVTGQSTLYVSAEHLPNAHFYTYKIGGGQQLYIPTNVTAAGEPILIKVAIKGIESNNTFKLEVAYGDQRPNSAGPTGGRGGAAGFSAISAIWLVLASFILLANRI